MTMKNILENKAKFFAQYFGQYIVTSKGEPAKWRVLSFSLLGESVLSTHLELKPLSDISDEDALKLYHLHSGNIGYDYTQDFYSPLEMARHWIDKDPTESMYKYTNQADYLRSKGYLVPFNGLSVEEIIKRGWAKYEET